MTSQLVLNVSGRLPIGGEFQGYNGDCVEYSLMVARCASNPVYPCNATELDRLTKLAIDDGEAASSGAMTNAELAWLCSTEGIPYSQFTSGDLIAFAEEFGGHKAICMGFSNGQALPGNEQGVHGHCIAVLDWDGNVFTVANGDSTNGRAGHFDSVTVTQMQAAQPTQVTALELTMTTPYDSYFTKDSATSWHLTANPAIKLQNAMLSYWQSINGLPALPLANENYSQEAVHPGHSMSFQRFERAVQQWDPDKQIDNPPGSGPVYLGHLDNPSYGVGTSSAELTINGIVTHVSKVGITYG